jgi:replication initiator protein
MRKRSRQYIIKQACLVEEVPALEADSIGFAHPLMAKCAMPTKRIAEHEYVRKNGKYKLTMIAPSEIGVPYGALSRIILCRITTLAMKSKSREIYLGDSLNQFVKSLDKISTGGLTGTLFNLKDQCKRLVACSISMTFETSVTWSIENTNIANNAFISWNNSETIWQPTLQLTQQFYDEVQEKAFPIDMRVLNACSHYPLAIDIYCWLTHRAFTLRRTTLIRWSDLIAQFGNSYSRQSNFRYKFKKAIERVNLFYSASNYKITQSGVLLFPSKPHIPKLKIVKNGVV